ncbi:hypothetical protein CELD12_32040 [Cellulomonas sp. NTE-D12]|nr:hypothetical protein CELD12_32040 [Cellulomonas sp. NTE-D12]
MELVAVRDGRLVAPLPLPELLPATVTGPEPLPATVTGPEPLPEPGLVPVPLPTTVPVPVPTTSLWPGQLPPFPGDLVADDSCDPVAVELAGLAEQARAVTAAAARFDTRLAAAYVWGASELAARCADRDARRRREWGARGMLAELAATLHVAEGTLARRLTRITMLAALPHLHAAHTAGLVSGAHVDGVLDVFHGVTDPDVLARADAALADRAARLTAPQLRSAARRWRARHVPTTAEQTARAVADRFVDVTPADADLCWLTALLPAAAATGIANRLDDLAAMLTGPDEPRTRPQLRADVLCDLLLTTDTGDGPQSIAASHGTASEEGAGTRPGTLASTPRDRDAEPHEQVGACRAAGDSTEEFGAGVPSWVRAIAPQVVLTVPVLTLLGHSDEPAELDGFGPIDLETARTLCANAPTFTRVLTHPETGTVLSVGRDRYTVPADLRRAVAIRDRTCRFPGCRRRAASCDVDHSTAWADGGTTGLDNLATLCRKHHRLKHETGWRVVHEGGGTLRWHSPTGRRYRTRPATALWPPPPARVEGDERRPVRASGASSGAPLTRTSSGYPAVPSF